MRKIISLLFVLMTSIAMFACNKKGLKQEVEVLTPNGTPFVAIGNLLGEENITIDNVGGSEPLITALSSGTYDIIIAPITAGAKLYVKGVSKYMLNSVVTINNTYIISRKSTPLFSINDLEGKTILAYGQNNTPDIALKNALGDIAVEEIVYKTDIQTVVTAFVGDTENPNNPPADTPEYILIAEPSLTQLQEKYKLELNILDLSKVMNETIYQAGIFVNPNSNQDAVDIVIKKIEENIEYLNKNPEEYAKKIVSKNRVFAALSESIIAKSIPTSNISFLNAKKEKENIVKFFNMINAYNDKIIGGVPNENFYK